MPSAKSASGVTRSDPTRPAVSASSTWALIAASGGGAAVGDLSRRTRPPPAAARRARARAAPARDVALPPPGTSDPRAGGRARCRGPPDAGGATPCGTRPGDRARANGAENLASVAAKRTSQQSASASPSPTQAPLTAAMTGFGYRSTDVRGGREPVPVLRPRATAQCVAVSAGADPRPAPVTTSARGGVVGREQIEQLVPRASIAGVHALSDSGRLSVSVATPSERRGVPGRRRPRGEPTRLFSGGAPPGVSGQFVARAIWSRRISLDPSINAR